MHNSNFNVVTKTLVLKFFESVQNTKTQLFYFSTNDNGYMISHIPAILLLSRSLIDIKTLVFTSSFMR